MSLFGPHLHLHDSLNALCFFSFEIKVGIFLLVKAQHIEKLYKV